jgi:hypothetical protein
MVPDNGRPRGHLSHKKDAVIIGQAEITHDGEPVTVQVSGLKPGEKKY